jgi:hypothetical protein
VACGPALLPAGLHGDKPACPHASFPASRHAHMTTSGQVGVTTCLHAAKLLIPAAACWLSRMPVHLENGPCADEPPARFSIVGLGSLRICTKVQGPGGLC